MRMFVVAIAAVYAWLLSAQGANAEPCAVRIATVHVVPQTHEYTVTMSSLVQGVTDVRVTLYAGATAYVAHAPIVRFVQEDAATQSGAWLGAWRWRAPPAFVRLPDDAVPPAAAVLEVIDPVSKSPIACAGSHVRLDPMTGSTYDDVKTRRLDGTPRADVVVDAGALIDATGTPAPVATCQSPFASARTDHVAQASYPAIARLRQETGKVFVRIEISATGSIEAATIQGSSGFPDLDEAARGAALASTYYPEQFRCEPVAGLYVFEVDFTGFY